MTRIQASRDCGNSPKNKFVQDMAIALECGKAEPDTFSENVVWEQASTRQISGRSAVLELLRTRPKPTSVTVLHAISHGKVGTANGEVTLANGHTRRFCHVFEFANAKGENISSIKSYS